MRNTLAQPPTIHLPARLCADVGEALRREWLVTNGIGGFACGTVAGALTRRYHGLLMAALRPPLGRTLLVAKLDEWAELGGRRYPLHANCWGDGVGAEHGCRWLRRFDLLLGVPTWRFELPGAALTRRIWMEPGRNTTYVQYELDERSRPVVFHGTLLVNYRDYHTLRHHWDRPFELATVSRGAEVRTPDGGPLVHVQCSAPSAAWTPEQTWYRDFRLPVEESRGQDFMEDHCCVGHCQVALVPGRALTFAFSAEAEAAPADSTALVRCQNTALQRCGTFEQQAGAEDGAIPGPVRQLALAADQFIVARTGADGEPGYTVIAGYPWFTDWGRDTMIALPGLTLCTGRFDVARSVLRTWSRYVDGGMIPNRFPDRGDTPEYHTADATLWYLWAIDQYMAATGDRDTLAELFPIMVDIVDWHLRGTRHNLYVGDDGLVRAGEEGINLTWMDAKLGDRVITPRMGKPVELSALWYDGLCNMARLARFLGEPGERFEELAERTRWSFRRYWNESRGCCYDVLDSAHGDDPTRRPNQIFAVSLKHSPLTAAQQRGVVDTCADELLTWYGLRSLARDEPGYHGQCSGDLASRDEAYHQGTAWGWLLGPFVLAHYRVHQDAEQARRFLEPMLGQLWTHGVGSLSEIFDGDEPHAPRGCIAQAWSVAETLRAWLETQGGLSEPGRPS
ncbi:MAG: amylo-alpha-1,6-glucosidase [Phycisphaerae bacterium]|jgi:predicted glycogen debranching enzyme